MAIRLTLQRKERPRRSPLPAVRCTRTNKTSIRPFGDGVLYWTPTEVFQSVNFLRVSNIDRVGRDAKKSLHGTGWCFQCREVGKSVSVP
jgi:hypothetical protein